MRIAHDPQEQRQEEEREVQEEEEEEGDGGEDADAAAVGTAPIWSILNGNDREDGPLSSSSFSSFSSSLAASVRVVLPPRSCIRCESDAVVAASYPHVGLGGEVRGGWWASFLRYWFVGESFFTTRIANASYEADGDVVLAPQGFGGIALHALGEDDADDASSPGSPPPSLLLTSGSYIASDADVRLETALAERSLRRLERTLFSGTGPFLLRASFIRDEAGEGGGDFGGGATTARTGGNTGDAGGGGTGGGAGGGGTGGRGDSKTSSTAARGGEASRRTARSKRKPRKGGRRGGGGAVVALGGCGAVHKYVLKAGEVRVIDNGHVVGWTDTVNYWTGLAPAIGGSNGTTPSTGSTTTSIFNWDRIVNSWTTGEGFMCYFQGPGTVYVQSHKPPQSLTAPDTSGGIHDLRRRRSGNRRGIRAAGEVACCGLLCLALVGLFVLTILLLAAAGAWEWYDAPASTLPPIFGDRGRRYGPTRRRPSSSDGEERYRSAHRAQPQPQPQPQQQRHRPTTSPTTTTTRSSPRRREQQHRTSRSRSQQQQQGDDDFANYDYRTEF